MRRFGLILLAVIGVAGVIHSVRAGVAQWIYFQTKFGTGATASPERILRWCETAQRLYGANYYVSILAATTAEKAGWDAPDGPGAAAMRTAAEVWCDRGLGQNPYRGELRRLKARILAERDPAAGVRYWTEYLEWDFWNPYHHAVMVDLLIRAGDYERAMQALKWTRDTSWYEPLARKLADAVRRERETM